MTRQEFTALLRKLEKHHGPIVFAEPTDPYELIVYANCGYPPSQDNCRKGFEALKRSVGLSPAALLAASERLLAKVLRAGGIVPELRASRLKLIARLVIEDFGGDLRSALDGSKEARKALKRFPTIGDSRRGQDPSLLCRRADCGGSVELSGRTAAPRVGSRTLELRCELSVRAGGADAAAGRAR